MLGCDPLTARRGVIRHAKEWTATSPTEPAALGYCGARSTFARVVPYDHRPAAGTIETGADMRRVLISLALTGSLLSVAAPTVLGHECFIASRSAAGDAGALHSGRWQRLGLADIFGFINTVVGGPALTADQITWAVNAAVAQGLPADGWVVRGDKTIGEGSSNPNLADGKGLDHLADAYGNQIVGIYFQALSH
jgi:hypothetical protein